MGSGLRSAGRRLCLIAGLLAALGSLVTVSRAQAVGPACPPTSTYSNQVITDRADDYYRLGDTTGNPMCDSSSTPDAGVYATSGVTYGVSGAIVGDADTAVAANGSVGGIGTSDANWSVSGAHDFSLAGWYRATGSPRDQALVAIGNAAAGTGATLATWSNHACGTGTESISDLVLDENGSSNCWDTTADNIDLYDGAWHFLVVTYVNSTHHVTGSIDGQSLGTQTADTAVTLGAAPLLVGRSTDTATDQPLAGDADEIAVFQSALTAADVTTLYTDAGRPAPAIAFATTSAQAIVSAAPGATASLPITITRTNGADGPVTLALAGLPSGVTLTGGGSIPAGSDTTTLQFSIAAGATPDTSTAFTIGAGSPNVPTPPTALAAQFTITGAAAGAPAITLNDGDTGDLGGYPGATVAMPITVDRANGAGGAVTLSVTHLPSGVTVTGGSAIAAGTDATTLQFAITAQAPIEINDQITISAASPGVSAIAPLTEYFVVEPATGITIQDPVTDTSGTTFAFGLEPCATQTVAIVVYAGLGVTTPTTLKLRTSGDTNGITESLSTPAIPATAAGNAYGVPATLSVTRASAAGSGPVTITITATNQGGSSTATVTVNRAGLTAQGLYVTQGSQYVGEYGLLLPSSPALSGHDYAGVTLVSGKKTAVRLYADAPGETQGLAGVTALLYGYDSHGHQLPGSPLEPDYGTSSGSLPDAHATAANEFVTDGELESDANAYTFTLPYAWTGGHLTHPGGTYPKSTTIKLVGSILPPPLAPSATAQPHPVRGKGAACSATDSAADNFTLRDVAFTEVGADYHSTIYPVALANHGSLPAPPSQVFAEAESAYPLPDNDFNVGTVPYLSTVDATSVFAGAAGQGWVASNHTLLSLLENDIAPSKGSHIVGVATPDFGWTNAIPGQYSVVSGGAHRPLTSVAHELGHQFGLPHASAACGGGGISWPPDQQGYLDGIGLNTTSEPYDFIADGLNGQGQAYDFMSYCAHLGAATGEPDDPDDWLSPRNWQQLITNFGTGAGAHVTHAGVAHAHIAARPGSLAGGGDPLAAVAVVDPQRLVVTGFVDSQGVQLGNVGPAMGAPPPSGSSVDTYTLTALGAGGKALATIPMAVTSSGHIDPGQGPAAPLVQISGDVPAAGVQSIEIADGSTVLASRRRPAKPPQVRILTPQAGAHVGGTRGVEIGWSASSPEQQALTVSVDYSADGGRTWRTEFVGPNIGKVTLSSFDFMASRNARVRLRVNDGFNETVVASGRFTTVGAAPYVTIASRFDPRRRFAGDASLQLAGGAVDQQLRPVTSRSLKWFDGPFALGSGSTISSGPLPPGVNHIRLLARGANGLTGSRTMTVTINRLRLSFLTLSIPRRLSPKAHQLTFKAKALIGATLHIDGRRFTLTRKLRAFRLPVASGPTALLLRLHVVAGAITTPFAQAVAR